MLKTYLYVPEELNLAINNLAKVQKISKAAVLREALSQGVASIKRQNMRSAQALLDLAKMAEKIPTKGRVPKDIVSNLDYYTWGGTKRG
ncbi:MAG: hypothetical protein Q8Q91_00485 [Candidatus Daviesbacteria bacterium]|nr:hypothetical protein [Candidatus Daviesbacteria bacterium]